MMNIQVYAQLSMQKKIQLTSFVVKFVMECAPGETGDRSFGSTELSQGGGSTFHDREAQIKRLQSGTE